MANQGCPGEGSDTRKFGSIVCFLQRLFSYKSTTEPTWRYKYIGLTARPNGEPITYVSFGIAKPFYVVRQWRSNGVWRLFRFGWRYDANWGGYIFPTAANKKVDSPMEKGY